MTKNPPFFKIIWIAIVCLFQAQFLYSQNTKNLNIENDIPETRAEISNYKQKKELKKHEFKDSILKIDNELDALNYSNAMAYIQSLYNKVKAKLEADINRYFPNTFRNYKITKSQFQNDELESFFYLQYS